uniref:Uncharacterized protein n=1 Tax=Panagrolaimus davidi TaxID=227884 RepID=A0A914QX53_9BILA
MLQRFFNIFNDPYIPKGRNNTETNLKRIHHDSLKLFIDMHYLTLLIEFPWISTLYLSDFSLSFFDWYMTFWIHFYAYLLITASVLYFIDRQNAYEWFFNINAVHIFMSLGILFDYGWLFANGFSFGDFRIYMFYDYGLYHIYALINFWKLKNFYRHSRFVIENWIVMEEYEEFLDKNFRFTFMPKGF